MAPTAPVPHRQHLVIGAVRTASSRTGLVLVLLAGERWCGASDLRDRSVISDQGAVRPGVGESRYVRLRASRNPACKTAVSQPFLSSQRKHGGGSSQPEPDPGGDRCRAVHDGGHSYWSRSSLSGCGARCKAPLDCVPTRATWWNRVSSWSTPTWVFKAWS